MGSTHAWQTFGDGEAPDIQAIAKGLGGGYFLFLFVERAFLKISL